jgi:hypothetical protein
VAGLLALVADALAVGLSRAVARDVADFAAYITTSQCIYKGEKKREEERTVVALLSLCAVAGHVAVSAARVAGLLATAKATLSTTAAGVAAALAAVTSNVSDLAALVAFLASAAAGREAAAALVAVACGGLSAVARDVAGLTAAVAGLFLGGLRAFTADVSLAWGLLEEEIFHLGLTETYHRSCSCEELVSSKSL